MSDGQQETQKLTGEGGAKLILFGEHAVVYGTPAIVAGTGAGATATVRFARESRLVVTDGLTGETLTTVHEADDEPLGRAYAAILDLFDVPASVEANAAVHVPVGAGMGSSAALAVALSRALAAFTDASPTLVEEAVARSEEVFHGSPSGIDQAAALRGGVFQFRRGDPPLIEPLIVPELRLLVCQASPGVSTAAMVGRVRALHDRFSALADRLDDAVADLVARARSAMEGGDWETVGALMNVNHGLLSAMGVSSEPLDAACHVAREAGAYGAKLTGSGGGGCVVAVAPDSSEVIEAWKARGWTTFAFDIHTPSVS